MMANKVAITISHQGASGGMDSANNHAVTKALPSIKNGITGRRRTRSISVSARIAVILASTSSTKIAGPK